MTMQHLISPRLLIHTHLSLILWFPDASAPQKKMIPNFNTKMSRSQHMEVFVIGGHGETNGGKFEATGLKSAFLHMV